MPTLPGPDSHHLIAASGWLDLGDHLSANEELEKITPELRVHPAVLELRWQIYAKAKQWELAIDIGQSLAALAPETPIGWIDHAYALHELKRTKEAWDTLFPAAAKFPSVALIPYNLACYAAQLGRLPEALELLKKAFHAGGREYKLMAFEDEDLKPVWIKLGNSLRAVPSRGECRHLTGWRCMAIFPLPMVPTSRPKEQARFIPPMLLTPSAAIPEGESWLYEVKWDGFRCIAVKGRDKAQLWSRNKRSLAARFPSLAEELTTLSDESLVLDGEIVWLNPDGTPSFQNLQNPRGDTEAGHLFFYAFDLLHRNGRSFLNVPLCQRKRELSETLAASRFFRVSHPLQGEPDQIVRCVREFKLEGIVAKHRDSLYKPGMRGSTWRKIKLYQSAEFLAGGFVPNPEGTAVEALLVGLPKGKTLRYAARVPLTLPVRAAETISGLLRGLQRVSPPFDHVPGRRVGDTWTVGLSNDEAERAVWLKPVVKATIEFIERSDVGHLRHCRFKGFVTK